MVWRSVDKIDFPLSFIHERLSDTHTEPTEHTLGNLQVTTMPYELLHDPYIRGLDILSDERCNASLLSISSRIEDKSDYRAE